MFCQGLLKEAYTLKKKKIILVKSVCVKCYSSFPQLGYKNMLTVGRKRINVYVLIFVRTP